jgi:hypothetical protein
MPQANSALVYALASAAEHAARRDGPADPHRLRPLATRGHALAARLRDAERAEEAARGMVVTDLEQTPEQSEAA